MTRVVLGALGVGVDPADEVLLRGGDAAADDDVLAGQGELAGGRLGLDRGGADLAEAAEAVRLAVEHQHPRGQPGRRPAAELDPGGAGVEVGARRVLEAGALEPDPALGVLAAPVVADHPRPASQLDLLAVDLQTPAEAGVGEGGDELGLRQRRLVEPVGGQVLAGLGVAVEGEVPGGLQRLGLDRAAGLAGADLGPATRIQEPTGAESWRRRTVSFVARGPSASRSKRTNQIEALGSAPGRLWTVWRIQIPRPPPGRQALM